MTTDVDSVNGRTLELYEVLEWLHREVKWLLVDGWEHGVRLPNHSRVQLEEAVAAAHYLLREDPVRKRNRD